MPLQLRADVTLCETTDALVLLDGRRGRYWQLNGTAATILRALLAGATPEQISADLSRKQPVTPDQATRDTTALIDQLLKARLAEHTPHPPR
ncbi:MULTISPECIES: lasso peptide biosynthesis PqqD family chaperone [Streptomyces]|uniref:lasso peptide biosynthesis PqqD family chaperone n=1 Tax=Streptomyces TaxID=1883 RepID=UPI001677CE02|nr:MULTISPECIES: lasso peptide biosynthesis PqqD family chaperone [Streptomyces]MBK3521097.1 lasso peptide biosynthesis PqqD family chaperone [Streptomyces sp. MBT70]GGR59968.1 hypothetical protein GCM10010236_10920 [Streptomyces eurythermus]